MGSNILQYLPAPAFYYIFQLLYNIAGTITLGAKDNDYSMAKTSNVNQHIATLRTIKN